MKRLYKVFLVEDEIVIRQGIRDRINWPAAGLEFCGEAPDGEIALPLIQSARPDILITDIKMPFMNGLELCRLVRESLPEIKIIILSGHDEFNYAREAIQLGVTEYLLKPLSAQDLLETLQKVALQIDKETVDRERLTGLQQQIEDQLPIQREKFLLQLVLGGISAVEALEKSMQLKLSLIARCYLVMVVRVEPALAPGRLLDYAAYQSTGQRVRQVVNRHSDSFAFAKGLEETVFILKGDQASKLEQDSSLLAEAIQQEQQDATGSASIRLHIGASQPVNRLGDIPKAFIEASTILRQSAGQVVPVENTPPGLPGAARPAELLKLNFSATDKYLKYGAKTGFNAYFDDYTRPIQSGRPLTRLLLEYLILDLLVTAANFVNELGGDAGSVIPELSQCEHDLSAMRTLEEVRALAQAVLTRALEFRDQHAGNPYTEMIARARAYIDTHFTRSNLSMPEVAAHVGLSSSHFSLIFSRETGETFIEYFTRRRIEKAMELLCTTSLKTVEISERVGYDNPHYFSTVFKKITGFSPTEYRARAHQNN